MNEARGPTQRWPVYIVPVSECASISEACAPALSRERSYTTVLLLIRFRPCHISRPKNLSKHGKSRRGLRIHCEWRLRPRQRHGALGGTRRS